MAPRASGVSIHEHLDREIHVMTQSYITTIAMNYEKNAQLLDEYVDKSKKEMKNESDVKVILLPINNNMHWYLASIFVTTGENGKEGVCFYLDSLGKNNLRMSHDIVEYICRNVFGVIIQRTHEVNGEFLRLT